MGKNKVKLRVFIALLFLVALTSLYQNCGPTVGSFNVNLGSSGLSGGTIHNTVQATNKFALGYEHSCGITSALGVQCWGAGSQGQLGYGGLTTYSLTPTSVIGLPATVAKISAGPNFTCALLTSGAIWCWGDDTYGQLGNNVQSTNTGTPVHAAVEGSFAYDIATSLGTTCAVLQTGIVQCWGLNGSGELGDGSQANSLVPVTVTGITNAVKISAGNNHFCATLSTGAVSCWGLDSSGQLGNQASSTAQTTAVAATGVTFAQKAVSGGVNTCALLSGSVSCWGDNTYGELGDGNANPTLAITPVTSIGSVTDLSVGQYSACALISGSVKCWGYNAVGNLGNGGTTSTSVPVSVSGLSNVTALASGTYHSCAYLNGGAQCWGYNNFGQLGNNSTADSTVPVKVTNFN